MLDRKYKPRTSKKRKFCENQHTRKSKTPRSSLTEQDIQINSVLSDQDTSIDLDLDVDLSFVSNSVSRSTLNLSRSEKKLGLNFDDTINDSSDDSDSENVHSRDYNNFGNRIIDISILRNQIADQLRCRYWKVCPKNKNHGLRVAKIAVAIATMMVLKHMPRC